MREKGRAMIDVEIERGFHWHLNPTDLENNGEQNRSCHICFL